MTYRFHMWRVAAVATVLTIAAGCTGKPTGIQEKTVPVHGKVVNGGEPLTVSKPMVGWVEVKFIQDLGGASSKAPETYSARADEKGAFTVTGRFPGRYRIAVRQWDPYPQTDKLKGTFDEKRTKIVREVTGKDAIVIDVAKPEG